MNTKTRMLRNTFYSSVSIYSEYILGLLCSIIIARSLGADNFGIYSLFIWVAASSIVLINGGLNTGQIKFLSEFKDTNNTDYALNILNYFRKVHTVKTLVVLLIAILLQQFILNKFELQHYSKFYWLILAAVLFRGRYMFYVSSAKGFEHFDKLAKLTMIVTPINFLLVLCAGIFSKRLDIFIYIYLITGILFYLTSKLLIGRTFVIRNKVPLSASHLKRINAYLKITSLIVIISYFVSKELELFLLGWLAEPSDAGMFRIAITLGGSILLMIPGVFSSVLLPMMSKSLAQSKELASRRHFESTRILIILSVPLAIFVAYMSTMLVTAIYGSEYTQAGIALSICILAMSIITIADSAQSYLLSAEKQKLVLYLLLISLVIKLTFGYFLIKYYQLIGASVTYLITIMFAYLSRIYLANKYLNSPFPYLTLSKTIVFALIAIIPVILINELIANDILCILISASLFGILFLLISLVGKLWSQEDIILIHKLILNIPSSSLRKLATYIVNIYR